MPETRWYHEIKGAATYWLAGIVFALVGAVFVAVGARAAKFFLFIGIPFLGLGMLVLILMACSLYLKVKQPENYEVWLWWVNFIGGLSGSLLFGIPSTFTLPALLLMERAGMLAVRQGDEVRWIGAVFSVIGLGVLVVVWMIARRQYSARPRWVKKGKPARRS
jgi:hypothetical protein